MFSPEDLENTPFKKRDPLLKWKNAEVIQMSKF